MRLDELPGPFALMVTIFVGLLGLVIGSFLNVVILRVPKEESIVFPGSHCPTCNRSLRWFENLPVLSWLFLGGKCRTCKTPISPRYAVIELLTGCLFLAALQTMQLTPRLPLALAFIGFIIPLVFIDIDHWIIEPRMALGGTAVGVLLQIPLGMKAVLSSLLGVAVAYVGFRLLELLGWVFTRREALGMGDKFLFALIAAYVGWKPLLGVLLLASMQGSVWGLLSIVLTGRAAPELKPDAVARGGSGGEAPKPETPAPPTTDAAAAPIEPTPVSPSEVEGPVKSAEPTPVSPSGVEGPVKSAEPTPFSPSGVEGPVKSAEPTPFSPSGVEGPTGSADARAVDGLTPNGPESDGAPPPSTAVSPETATLTPGTLPEPEGDDEDAPLPFTPEFTRPGLTPWQRLAAIPYTLFLQPIPDDPPLPEGADEDAEPEWTPGVTNMPFGPWLGLGGLEVLLLGSFLAAHIGNGLIAASFRSFFLP